MNDNQPIAIPAELIEHLNQGACVLFVGDALESPERTSARLAAALVDACGAYCSVCQEQATCQRPVDCAVPLTEAAQLYESSHNRQGLVNFVRRQVDNQSPPAPVHRALAALPVRIIITTAFDDRLERALQETDRPISSVLQDTDIPFDDPGRVQLIRLQGSVSRPDSLVLTQDDSNDLFARLPTVATILRGHFASKTLLFVGYALADPHFHLLYRQVTGPIARYQRLAYALQWRASSLLADRWRQRIKLIAAAPVPFLSQLSETLHRQAVQTIQAALPPQPYKFLDYFTEEDVAIFFGRDLEADRLLSTILSHRLAVFYGASGTGKTSLLLARVVPALREAGYQVAYARMLGDPVKEVKAAARRLATVDDLTMADLNQSLLAVLVSAAPPGGRLVIILDQFEEFFLRQGEAVRRAFAQELAAALWPAAAETAADIRCLLSLRDDYLGGLDELTPYLAEQDIFAHRYRIRNLTPDKALQAILKPAEAFCLPVDGALQARLVTDLDDGGLEPASLQIVLFRLYEDALGQGLWSESSRQGDGLTLARYEQLGETQQILAGYLDEVVAALPGAAEQAAVRMILKSMVTAERTKAAVNGQEISRSELVQQAKLDETQLDRLLSYLRDRRVVRKLGEEERYELAHDVMVGKVWAWVSDEELRLLDVRGMLRREMSSYRTFGHLLTAEKLALLAPLAKSLVLAESELTLIFRSAIAAGHDVLFWFDRARSLGVDLSDVAREGLASENFRGRAAAVTALARLGEPFAGELIPLLADDFPQVRVATIHALERLRPDLEWHKRLVYECYVPPGPFIMGDDSGGDDEKPAHEVDVDAFYIGKYPVTNVEYKRYMDDIGRAWDLPPNKKQHPVVNVSWYDAHKYAVWADMCLLSEAEWEKAATWAKAEKNGGVEEDLRLESLAVVPNRVSAGVGSKRLYPWGDKFDRIRCNTREGGLQNTTRVGCYSPEGDSPYGAADMAGNVWEWTSSLFSDYPFDADDGREDPNSIERRAIRGGSFYNDFSSARGTYRRHRYPADVRGLGLNGFRCGVASRPVSRSF